MNMIKKSSIGIFLVFFLYGLYPTQGYSAESWPVNHCANVDSWLKFSEMDLCFDKSQIVHLDYLDLSAPSLAMIFYDHNHKKLDVVLSRLDDDKVTGGLHARLGVGVQDVFKILAGDYRTNKNKEKMVRKVMDVGDDTFVRRYTNGALDAYTLIRPKDSDSSIYIFHKNRSGAIEVSGNMNESDARYILSEIHW